MPGLLLRTLRGENASERPVWLMRQAGRYLPEYRSLRAEKGGFLALVYDTDAAAEITLRALALLEPGLRGLDAHLVNVVHDELVLESSESNAEAACMALEAAMVAAFLDLFPGGPTQGLVDVHTGRNWAVAKP